MAEPRVGLQLIIYGRRSGSDLAGVLGEAEAAGYAGFEGGASADPKQVEHVQNVVAKTTLAFTGGHCGVGDLADPEQVKRRISGVKALGGRYLVASGQPWETLEEHLAAARTMNQAGGLCQEAGIRFCYHNHHWEFRRFDGTVAMHAMIAATEAGLVHLCPDVYWVHVGGEDPAEFISRYRDRCPYFHFKDGLGGDQFREFRELGRGRVDLAAALKAALACDPEWIVVEQDTTQMEPAESVRISREYLKSLGL
jgi:sugar phosphate isomerase/epimerase